MTKQKLILATSNAGKVVEFQRLLAGLPVTVQALADYPAIGDIKEDGATFAENALIKARAVARVTGVLTVADDSGLMVDCLDGAPGIYSARFAGEDKNDAQNMQKLLQLMQGVADAERGAQFCCAMAMVMPDGQEYVTEGICRGVIARTLSGDGGFGYDPLFYVPTMGKTFAQLSLAEKNAISHRGQATQQAIAILRNLLGGVQ